MRVSVRSRRDGSINFSRIVGFIAISVGVLLLILTLTAYFG